MKRICVIIFLNLLFVNLTTISAQVKKLISEINSTKTKEVITFKYNNKNQLIYFDEKGTVTYREFSLKYNKANGQLIECKINQDRGELITHIKYDYTNTEYIKEEAKNSGKKIREKFSESNNIYIDLNNKLTKTTFDDGKLWEEFKYDNNDNITTYTIYSTQGNSDIMTNYSYSNKNSIFSNITNMPSWFWVWHLNNMKWCEGLTGKNIPTECVINSSRYGNDTIEVSYDYDIDGYPIKQYYNGEIVKEFSYIMVQ